MRQPTLDSTFGVHRPAAVRRASVLPDDWSRRGGPGIASGVAAHAGAVVAAREAAWRRYSELCQQMTSALAVLDREMRVAVWNDASATITGCPAAAAIGSRCEIAGNQLVLCLASRDAVRPPAGPALDDVRLCEFRVSGGLKASVRPPALVAILPVASKALVAVLHFVEAPRPAAPATALLTRRERQILHLLAEGKSAKPIALELSLSVPTVRTHIQHILRKLGVHSCLEAAVHCLGRPPSPDRSGRSAEPPTPCS